MTYQTGCHLAAIVAGVLLLPSSAHADPRDCPAELERLEAENERLEAEVAELRARLGGLEAENLDLKVVAGVTPPGAGPDGEAAAAASLTEVVAGDARVVATRGSELPVTRGSSATHWVSFRYQRSGDGPPEAITMVVRTWFSGGIYRGVRSLHLAADGQEIECPVTDYDATAIRGGGRHRQVRRDHEFVTVAIPAAALDRITAADRVTGKLGRMGFAFDGSQRAALRVIRSSLAE
jgi:hypothetical protein